MGNFCGKQTGVDAPSFTACQPGNHTQPTTNPPGDAQVFLERLGLGIYSQAFRLAGLDDVAQLQTLTQQELALAIERHSHVPILPGHAQEILQAAASHARAVPSLAANDAAGSDSTVVHVTRSRPVTPGQHTLLSKEPSASRVTLPSPRPAGSNQPSAGAAAAAAAAGIATMSRSSSLQSVHCLPQATAARPGPTPAPAAGPLTAHRTALGASSAARPPPPPAATQRRPQPTAWAELAGEVSGLSLAATASLAGSASGSRQPSPRGVSLPGALAAHAPALITTPRQSDPGLTGQQQLPQQGRAGAPGPGMAPTQPAAGGGSFRVADLPPSVQQLHEKMLGRLRAQGSSSSSSAAAADVAGGGLFAVSAELSGSSLPSVAEHSSSGRTETHAIRLARPAEQQLAGGCGGSRPGSAAGSSCVSGGGWDLRPGSSASTRGAAAAAAARASDVSGIVHQARERVAARHRLPALQNTSQQLPQQQQQQQLGMLPAGLQGEASTAGTTLRAPAAHLSRAGSSSSGGGGGVLSPRQHCWQQQAVATAAGLLLQGERTSAATTRQQQQQPQLAESSIARACADVTVSAAFRDGERKMRMMQEYRAIGELDSAIQARVQQLSHQTVGTQAAAAGGDATAAVAGCWRPGMAPTGADTAKKAADYQQELQQQQLEPVPSASPLLFKKRHAAAGGGAAGGLLGIREALNNSFDCGQVHRGSSGQVHRGRAGVLVHTVAAAAAGQGAGAPLVKRQQQHEQQNQQQPGSARSRLASGGSGFKSRPSSSGTSKAAAAASGRDGSGSAYFTCQDNPFVSPEPSLSRSAGADDNPFLRESLVLQPVQGLPAFGSRC